MNKLASHQLIVPQVIFGEDVVYFV